jgi:hypothetical protein
MNAQYTRMDWDHIIDLMVWHEHDPLRGFWSQAEHDATLPAVVTQPDPRAEHDLGDAIP